MSSQLYGFDFPKRMLSESMLHRSVMVTQFLCCFSLGQIRTCAKNTCAVNVMKSPFLQQFSHSSGSSLETRLTDGAAIFLRLTMLAGDLVLGLQREMCILRSQNELLANNTRATLVIVIVARSDPRGIETPPIC